MSVTERPPLLDRASSAGAAASGPPPGVFSAIRGAGVTLGPPAVLDLIFAGSVATTVAAAFMRPGRRAWTRALRPLAGLGAVAAAAYYLLIRPWHMRWGATDDELRLVLPGDELLPHPLYQTTHALTIHAPPAAVWPWIAQIGTGRAGWYSHDCLENLAGLDIHSAERIIPALQDLKVGDQVLIAPAMGFVVVALEPGRALVLRSFDPPVRRGATDARAGDRVDVTWTWVLDPLDGQGTRLLVRYRVDGSPRNGPARAVNHLVEIPEFVMERKMLLGIKQRAERGDASRRVAGLQGGRA